MELKDKNLSLQFYNYLCDIIGSEDVVRTRREIFTAQDICDNITFATSISSGSKAGSLDRKGSNIDQIMQLEFIRVYEGLNDVQSNPDKILLVMFTNDTKPGFTKKLVSKSYLDSDMIHDWCETVGEEMYISSKRFREQHLRLCDDMVMHGPCQSTATGEYDNAICFRCNEWITPAQQWIHRSHITWPHYTLVTSAECLTKFKYNLSKCSPDMIHLHLANSLVEQTAFEEIKHRCGLLLAIKHLVIENVCFRHPCCLLPDELIPVITGESLIFPLVVYSYLLQFLCCYQLRDNRGKQKALHDLELTINKRCFISPSEK
ncbi:unnamed protein product [Mytilus coruscus]|uniref:Uncharacterized protein n=1 Tax=Mytilus coruscus TaxID=42192 RepID=A0A6J8EDW3_MYTCO|nr:unnamed protein product [Mytilus coruscus]